MFDISTFFSVRSAKFTYIVHAYV